MKKFLIMTTALIGTTLVANLGNAMEMNTNKVDVFLNGDIESTISLAHNNAKAYNRITGEKVDWHQVRIPGAEHSGFKDLNSDIWTEAYVGIIANINVDHDVVKQVMGHVGLVDGSDTFLHDHTVDTYIKVKTKFGDLTVGDRDFTDEMMITGGADYDTDEDEYLIPDASDTPYLSAGETPVYASNTQWYSAESDLDLAEGSEARIQYKSPLMAGFNIGAYMALSGDDGAITASDNDGFAYLQENTYDRSTRADYSYGAGVSYMHDFANHLLLDADVLYQNHGKTNVAIVSGKVIIPMESMDHANADIMKSVDPAHVTYDRSLWLKGGYTMAHSTYQNDMTLAHYYMYGDPYYKGKKGVNHNMYGSVGMSWDYFDMGLGIFGGFNKVQSAVGFGAEAGINITHGVHWTVARLNMEHRKTDMKASTIGMEESQTAYSLSSKLKISF